ncbi:MAG: aryl-sulfate sulfotransferase, partial [Planctomycetes bacterium]|nr:aryl-sulfate sulfotransferase [Planctomycetota bacterium]
RGSRVIEVSPEGLLVAAWLAEMEFVHNADPIAADSLLLSDTGFDRVIEVDATGTVLWNSDDHSPFSDGSTLSYPNDANLLSSGNLLITDRDNNRIIEIDCSGNVVWQYGVTGVPGSMPGRLNGPHNADRLANGNTLVADSNNDRILEIDPAGTVVWFFQPAGADALDWPRDADRLENGNTLITDSNHNRILEVDPAGAVVWKLEGLVKAPYDADRLPDGNTLLSDPGNHRVIEVDAAGTIVWQYPGTVATTSEVAWVRNPTSGVDLYTQIHEPADAGPNRRYPALVYVPGGSGTGQNFYSQAAGMAAEGFIAVHFDPDGRGLSTDGGAYTEEDYCGHLHQDGLQAVLQYLAFLPEVDHDNIGILSTSYGITMASGMLARYQDKPPVRWLIDYEGPADRNNTAQINGGHVPVDPSDHTFWSEREAAIFIKEILPVYTRIQSEGDHNHHITDNHHAIALINGATHTTFLGEGISLWTRVNRACDNIPNRVYTLDAPSVWYPDHMDDDLQLIKTLLVRERASAPTLTLTGDLTTGGRMEIKIALGEAVATGSFFFAFSLGDGPVWVPGVTTLHLDPDALFFATLLETTLDGTGGVDWSLEIPEDPVMVNTYFAQAVYAHPGSSTGWSASTGAGFAIAE